MHADSLAFMIWKGDPLAVPQYGYYNYYEGWDIDGGAFPGLPGVCPDVIYPMEYYHQKRGIGRTLYS